MDGLVQPPGLGQLQLAQKVHRPHPIELHQDPFRLIAPVHFLQKFGVELLLPLDGDQATVALGEKLGVVLLLAVLAHEEDGALTVVKVIHIQRVGKKGGFAGVQKAGDKIQGDPTIGHDLHLVV